MIEANEFISAALKYGYNLWSGVPCSYLKPFINYIIDSPQVRYVPAVNEGDAVAIVSGHTLAGNRGVAIFQNSGLGNAVNPLTSLNHTFQIPILLIITLRGEPGGPADAPQHGLMGSITTDMLDTMAVKWEYFPTDANQIAPALNRATEYMDAQSLPFAFVMKKEAVGPYELKKSFPSASMPWVKARTSYIPESKVSRTTMLKTVQSNSSGNDVILGTTGYTGRELYALQHQDNQFYMVGSMGCVSSLALGIAIARPNIRVIALDGDGAILMRMGAMATNGYQRPANMVHIVLDNSCHESTGGQYTVSPSVDLCAVAASCGYEHIWDINQPEELEAILTKPRNAGLTFIRARILPGTPKDLPRPTQTTPELAVKFAAFLQKN